jgi:hypothetical protein
MFIQTNPWLLWLLLTSLLYIGMFLLVPRRLIQTYLPMALVYGWVQAVIVIWIFQFSLQMWRLAGDPVLLGITTLFTPVAWIAPTIIFAAYFPRDRTWLKIGGYILLYALGAVATYLFLQQLGLWENIRWNALRTGLLSLAAHLNISLYLLLAKTKIKR